MPTNRAQLPAPHVPLIDSAGRVDPSWYDFFRRLDRLAIGDLQGVDLVTTPPVGGNVLTYSGVSGKWEPV